MAVIYQKYRPATFASVTGQAHVITTIQNQYGSGSLAHAYLFTGPRGVGKTTTARLLAKIVNCLASKDGEPCNACPACVSITSGQALDVYEIDAASHTDVENVRENIIKSVRFAPNILKKKVYIIDEVHMLSTSSFNALLKTLEEPPDHALFILATTEIHKVPETIISRCQRFDFKRISPEVMIARLEMIAKEEGMTVEPEVFVQIARHSGGCARDAESLVGQIFALGEKTITLEIASLVLPTTNALVIDAFIRSLLSKDVASSITQLNDAIDQGIDLVQFVDDVISRLRDTLLETISGRIPPLQRGDKGGSSVVDLRFTINKLLEARNAARGDFLPQLPIELAIVDVCGVPSTFKPQGVDSSRLTILPEPAEPSSAGVEGAVALKDIPLRPHFAKVSSGKQAQGVLEEIEITDSITLTAPDLTVVETVFDTVPVLNIDEVRRKWPEVFEQIKACNASLPLFMHSCEVGDVQGDRVELTFEYDLHVQTVNKDKNRLLIENVLERVLGHVVRIKAIKSSKAPDQNVLDLAKQFGGSVT